MRWHRLAPAAMWALLALSLLLQLPVFLYVARLGRQPIDFLAYSVAAQALARGDTPYQTIEQSQAIWRRFHHDERAIVAAAAAGHGAQAAQALAARPQQPGPYVYPPTLALLVAQLRPSPLLFACLSLLAIGAWAWLWLKSSTVGPLALWLIIGSADVLNSSLGGNVELLLLALALGAGWLLWHRHPIAAAPLCALVVLVKPFYALLFIALGCLALAAAPATWRATLRSLLLSAALCAVVVVLEAARWGSQLRAQTLDYLRHALAHQWLTLPPAEQTPMSAWNRTSLQALITAGMAPGIAQWAALLLWGVLLLVTLVAVRGKQPGFALAFALALVLLYWSRPVGWTLVYLEVVLVGALWPRLPRAGRLLLLVSVVGLMLSHWWALVLASRGMGMQLLTLQSAAVPWETWIVLPLSWLVLVYGAWSNDQRSRGLWASCSAEPDDSGHTDRREHSIHATDLRRM